MKVRESRCPCCGIGNDRFLYKLNYGDVYKCADCKTAYTAFKGLGAEKSNQAFSTPDYVKARLYDQYELRRIARKRLDLLGKFINGGEILEFGSSTGEFLYEAAKKGYKVSSVDLYPTVLNINKVNNLREIIARDAASFKAKEAYDAVAAFHVIEHLANPGEFLENCNSALKPHGVLFLEVPNFCSLTRRILGKRSGMFYDYHICHFDKDSLASLIRKHGYEILAVRAIDDPLRYITPIYNPLRHGLRSLIKKLVRRRSGDAVRGNISNNALTGYPAMDEIQILNSNKAKIYRLEADFIRAASKVLLPISMILDNYYLSCSLQMIAKRGIDE